MRANTALVGKTAYHGYDSLASGEGGAKAIALVKRQVADASDSDYSEEEKSNTSLLTIDLLPTDTLQSLALQYRCPVNDIKRVNALITEQDLYARQTIKIPIQKYSLLSERGPRRRTLSREDYGQTQFSTTTFAAVKDSNCAAYESSLNEGDSASAPLLPINDTESSSSCNFLQKTKPKSTEDFRTLAAEKNDVTGYLKSLDKDIRKTVKKADLKSENANATLNELTSSIQDYSSSLPTIQRRPLHRPETVNGADCGFKWWSVLLCFFLVLLLILFLALMEFYFNSK